MNRRRFIQATAASAATLALSRTSFAADNPDFTAIQREIETPLARRILVGEVREGQVVHVDVDRSGNLRFDTQVVAV